MLHDSIQTSARHTERAQSGDFTLLPPPPHLLGSPSNAVASLAGPDSAGVAPERSLVREGALSQGRAPELSSAMQHHPQAA